MEMGGLACICSTDTFRRCNCSIGPCVYGKNWPKKCAELVQRGVDIFLMPNLVYILDGKSLPGVIITWTEEQMSADWGKVQRDYPAVRSFLISKTDVLTLHPLVVGTRRAETAIVGTSRPHSNFLTHWINVEEDRTFFVFYRARGDETCAHGEVRVRSELLSHYKA